MKILFKSINNNQNPAKFVYDNFGTMTKEDVLDYQSSYLVGEIKDSTSNIKEAIEVSKKVLSILEKLKLEKGKERK